MPGRLCRVASTPLCRHTTTRKQPQPVRGVETAHAKPQAPSVAGWRSGRDALACAPSLGHTLISSSECGR